MTPVEDRIFMPDDIVVVTEGGWVGAIGKLGKLNLHSGKNKHTWDFKIIIYKGEHWKHWNKHIPKYATSLRLATEEEKALAVEVEL